MALKRFTDIHFSNRFYLVNYKFLMSTGIYKKIAKEIRDCQSCKDNFSP